MWGVLLYDKMSILAHNLSVYWLAPITKDNYVKVVSKGETLHHERRELRQNINARQAVQLGLGVFVL